MEDVLDGYELPYNPNIPLVCMDEKPYQLLGDARQCLPMRPGNDQKIDSEYVRNGTCSIFAFVEPLGGTHHVSVREHRTALDWAERMNKRYNDKYQRVNTLDSIFSEFIYSSEIEERFQIMRSEFKIKQVYLRNDDRIKIHFLPKLLN